MIFALTELGHFMMVALYRFFNVKICPGAQDIDNSTGAYASIHGMHYVHETNFELSHMFKQSICKDI